MDAAALLSDLRDFVTHNGERAANKPTHEGARVWLMDHFKAYGLDAYRHDFTGSIPEANIVGIHWGRDRENWVVVGGHYDTMSDDCLFGGPCVLRSISQGAYDDGSGTIMTVALAKAYANVITNQTIAFIAFDGEELGLEGSAAFTQDYIDGKLPWHNMTITGMLDLDMFGLNWPGVNAPVEFLTNSAAVKAAAEKARIALGVPDDMMHYTESLALGTSDYGSFYRIKVPTGFFISDFDAVGVPLVPANTPTGAYPFWHFEDTMETMTAMAGDEAHLEEGFQLAADLAAHVVHHFAYAPVTQP